VGEVLIRLAGPDDALVVAGLTLQCALHRGGRSEPGFLDRFAHAWSGRLESLPIWIAEAADQHAGYLQGAVLPALPWPAQPQLGGTLVVETFFVRPAHRGIGVGEQLLKTALGWARDQGLAQARMTAGPHTRPMVERVGFTADQGAHRMEL
jgi:GNAT superfamily N-acetyltransferase